MPPGFQCMAGGIVTCMHALAMFLAGHLASRVGVKPANSQTCIVSQSVQVDTGKMWTCRFLGGPEVPLEIPAANAHHLS